MDFHLVEEGDDSPLAGMKSLLRESQRVPAVDGVQRLQPLSAFGDDHVVPFRPGYEVPDQAGVEIGHVAGDGEHVRRVAVVKAGVDPGKRKDRVKLALEDFGLADRARHRPDQLSGGQRQRVAIARATIMEPQVILADEPTGNLDRASGKEVIEILEKLNKKGIILILVTHDPDIGNRAVRKISMVDGKILDDTLAR